MIKKIKKCKEEILKILDLDDWTLDLMMLPIICDGHAVLHGMIGTAKTAAIMTLGKTLDMKTGIYQCHPETMPSDIIGFEKFNQKTKEFDIRNGPILDYEMLLVDEINRMSPRSQAALLGPMAQGKVTIGEKELNIKSPFVVYATMNPIESQGVYPLSEAQVDRFLLQIPFPYHSYEGIERILSYPNARATQVQIDKLKPVINKDEILKACQVVNNIPLGDAKKWITAVYLACCPERDLGRRAPKHWKPLEEAETCVQYGPSPRALRDLAQAARGISYLNGRPIVKEDVEKLAIPVLRHRIVLRRQLPEKYRKLSMTDQVDKFIEEIIKTVKDRYTLIL
jgi:MoxR-like ATPase